MQVKCLSQCLLVILLCAPTVVLAEEPLTKAFLDYLTAFETDDGEWVDPEELQAMADLGKPEQEVDNDEE